MKVNHSYLFGALVLAAIAAALSPGGGLTRANGAGPNAMSFNAAALLPVASEPPPRLIVDAPLPEALAKGLVVVRYRTENLRILPVFGPAAREVSPRIG